MATLFIAQYNGLAHVKSGHRIFDAPRTPPLAQQALTYTSSAASNAFAATATYIEVTAIDANAVLAFGSAPTADGNSGIIVPQNATRRFSIIPGQKVAAWDGTT